MAVERLREAERRAEEAERRAEQAMSLMASEDELLRMQAELARVLDQIAEAQERIRRADERTRRALAAINAPLPHADGDQSEADEEAEAEEYGQAAAGDDAAAVPDARGVTDDAEDRGGEPAAPAEEGDAVPEQADGERQPEPEPRGRLIDINRASYDELRQLGLSLTLTGRVLAAREKRGGFASLDDLDQIPGFSAGELRRIKPKLRV